VVSKAKTALPLKHAAHARTPASNAGGWRTLVTVLALIAFAFQSYVTQTHIHLSPAVAKAAITGDAHAKILPVAHRSAPAKEPANDEPMKCPLCQAVGYAGHFVTPAAAAAMLLPTAAVSVLPLLLATVSPNETPSHIWQGRGPPNS